jgi:hypothetical protein
LRMISTISRFIVRPPVPRPDNDQRGMKMRRCH